MKCTIFAMLALAAACSSASVALAMPIAPPTGFDLASTLKIRPEAALVSWQLADNQAAASSPIPPELQQQLESLGLYVRPLGQNRGVVISPDQQTLSTTQLHELRHHPLVTGVQRALQAPAGLGANTSNGLGLHHTLFFDGEFIVQLAPGTSDTMAQAFLTRQGFEIVRPLRFAESKLLVRSRDEAGDSDLMASVMQQLRRSPLVVSVEPNLIQNDGTAVSPDAAPQPDSVAATGEDLLAQAWHLDSRLYRGQLLPRTDVQAPEAWAISRRGQGVTVAVIDSTIQWDHPDLINQTFCLQETDTALLPGEACGYDFVDEDGDTRLSDAELAELRPGFQDSFLLNDRALLRRHGEWVDWLGLWGLPQARQAQIIRWFLRFRVEVNFHGTWSAGVIAAQGNAGEGLLGVAPEAQILPVRVFDLDGYTSTSRLIEATGYAAARGVDVINLSLGGLLPSEAMVNHLFELQDQYPNLVIVASAGNSNLDGVGFPAAIPGVLSVGATNLEGQRAPYSNYGGQLDVVAPGGDLSLSDRGGLLTTGGTWLPALWEGMELPTQPWGYGLDPLGQYVRVEGTSFSAPTVAGVVALMRGEDPNQRLDRQELITRLTGTATYDALTLSAADQAHYRLQRELRFGTVFDLPYLRPSGIYEPQAPVSAEQYYFGAGLVNALRAVQAMQR
jgi:subtilisin family serine protease